MTKIEVTGIGEYTILKITHEGRDFIYTGKPALAILAAIEKGLKNG